MKQLKVANFNARSLFTGFDELQQHILHEKYDFVAITETWLLANISSDIVSIPGYKLIRNDRDGRGGGVCFYVQTLIKVELLKCDVLASSVALEQLWITYRTGTKTFAIGVFYRPPSASTTDFFEYFETSLSAIIPMVDEVVCTGDVNIDLLDNQAKLVRDFNSLLDAYGLTQMVTKPTRYLSLLDPFMVSDSELVDSVDML